MFIFSLILALGRSVISIAVALGRPLTIGLVLLVVPNVHSQQAGSAEAVSQGAASQKAVSEEALSQKALSQTAPTPTVESLIADIPCKQNEYIKDRQTSRAGTFQYMHETHRAISW